MLTLIDYSPVRLFRANPDKTSETNGVNEHNVKNPNWQEADQVTISATVAEELNSGAARTAPPCCQNGT